MTLKSPPVPERVKSRLRGTSKLRLTLSDVRKSIDPKHYPALIAWLPMVRHRGRGVFSGQFPSHLNRLKRDWVLEAIPPEREILWATEILKSHASRINSFVAHAQQYERTLLGEGYPRSFDLLDTIEREFGVSLWSIENRIASFQVAQGLERQKAYVNTIRGERVSNAVAVIAFYVSQRNESATNPLRFRQQMAERSANWEVPEEYKMYLLFRIADDFNFGLQTCAAILRYEATSSIVDYYETFIRVAQNAALSASLPTPLLSGLESLSVNIKDHRARKILLLNNREHPETLASLRVQQLSPLELLAKDQFQSAIAAVESSVKADPTDVTLRFVSAQSMAELNAGQQAESGLGNRIERLCSLLVNKEEDPEDVYLETLRLEMAFHLLGFSGQLQQFTTDHFSSQPNSSKAVGLKAFLDSPYLDPRHLMWLPEELRPSYASTLLNRYGPTPAVLAELWRANVELPGIVLSSIEGIGSLGNDAVLRIKIHRELESKEVQSALILARELDRSQSKYSRRLAARYIAHCLFELQRLSEAIDFIVDRVVSDPPAVFMLPIAQCVERLDKSSRKSLAGKLSTPIILDLFSRFVSDRLDNIRAYAYEDFLISQGIERPSELIGFVDRFDRKLLTYYLSEICIPDIMQVSSTFRGSQELEQERVAVCSILRQIDESNVKGYESEIREITRKQVIQMGMRHVDLSRIFVDVAAIRRWAERNLKEGFARYRALLEAGVDTGANAFTEALEDALNEGTVDHTILALPKNEANDLLFDLVSRIFIECMTNPEYGLDCYLSMRIRHGALSGQLRGPLEEQKVITQREGGSRQYKPNEFWLEKLTYPGTASRQELDARLAQFSQDYDAIIDNFAGGFVQVRSTKKQGGLFSTAIPELFLGAVAAAIKKDTSFDDFVTFCFDLFWRCVEGDLKVVRNKIDAEVKPAINSLFAALQSDLANLVGYIPTQDLDRAIRIAQTGAQNALNQVNEWFRLRKPESVPSLRLEEIIDISLKCVEKIHPDFRPQISQAIPSMPPFLVWTPLSDIFFIVFENIQNHSGIVSPVVEICGSEREGQVRIAIRSQVGDSVDTSEAKRRVAKIKDTIREGAYQRGARSEGGTGLMKLRKIIGEPNHLDFGFANETQFYVELEFPYRDIRA